ncbi:hypothetical protein [Motilibacter deserti]|uniref:Uncharacterized protein n=1 Tax=Motilibacter deserti TaxID=2714956 RepID=A0ABX0H0V5_9ACTN|nr:hypothetical protein [Motilibacter deserti]NHC15464.1 hypothetical protein [Motilibacter deserti]
MALQLRDALRPYLPEGRRVRLAGLPDAAGADLVRHLQLLDGADVAADDPGASAGSGGAGGSGGATASGGATGAASQPGVLTVLGWPVGDPAAEARVEQALDAAPAGATLAVVLDQGALVAPWPRLLDVAGATDCQVLDAVPVLGDWPLVVLLAKDGPLVPPARYLGPPSAATAEPGAAPEGPAAQRRLARRLAGELVFAGLRERALTAQLADVRAELDALRTQPPPQGELQAARREAAAAQARVLRLESSGALRLGRALAGARSPRGALRLPAELAALARSRSAGRGAAGGGRP